jgi:hypothetical protein
MPSKFAVAATLLAAVARAFADDPKAAAAAPRAGESGRQWFQRRLGRLSEVLAVRLVAVLRDPRNACATETKL